MKFVASKSKRLLGNGLQMGACRDVSHSVLVN